MGLDAVEGMDDSSRLAADYPPAMARFVRALGSGHRGSDLRRRSFVGSPTDKAAPVGGDDSSTINPKRWMAI